ncbi:MAG: aminotransferase class III-fold pyridoxal phosphate-dependent enzyme, partial [Vulcanimicrobiaceae bacterium]
ALASLDLFQSEGTLERASSLALHASKRLDGVRARASVREARQAGLMIGIELRAEPEPGAAGARVAEGLYARGHFTRAIGDVVQFVPPLSSTPSEVDGFFDALLAELDA